MQKNGTEEQKKEEDEQEKSTEEEVEEVEETLETLKTEDEIKEDIEEIVEDEEELPEVEDEIKPPPEKKVEEEIVEERIYTIPLGKAWIAPTKKRAPKAMKIIKNFINRHMKLKTKEELEEAEQPEKLIISNEVNEKIWRKGIEKPPRKVRVRAAKDKDGNITIYLAE